MCDFSDSLKEGVHRASDADEFAVRAPSDAEFIVGAPASEFDVDSLSYALARDAVAADVLLSS